MTLSENPHIEFDDTLNGAVTLTVRAIDTSNAVWEREFPVGSGSQGRGCRRSDCTFRHGA